LVEREIFVTNPDGLHARPSAALAKVASRFKSEITISNDTICIDAKNVINVLQLCAPFGTKLTIKVSGSDEMEALSAIEEIFGLRYSDD
jgi:phosphocarrier protein